jgi:hypothetical protein
VKTRSRLRQLLQQKQRYLPGFTCLFLWWLKMKVTWLPPPPHLPSKPTEEQEVKVLKGTHLKIAKDRLMEESNKRNNKLDHACVLVFHHILHFTLARHELMFSRVLFYPQAKGDYSPLVFDVCC